MDKTKNVILSRYGNIGSNEMSLCIIAKSINSMILSRYPQKTLKTQYVVKLSYRNKKSAMLCSLIVFNHMDVACKFIVHESFCFHSNALYPLMHLILTV